MQKEIDYSQLIKFATEVQEKFPYYAANSAMSAMKSMGDFLLGQVPEYPPHRMEITPPDGVSFLKTDKQRAWFFAAVRKGEIEGWQWVPARYTEEIKVSADPRQTVSRGYKPVRKVRKILVEKGHPIKIGSGRTGSLGRAQGKDVDFVDGNKGVVMSVGFDKTIAPYAPWVVGPDYPGEEGQYQAQIHVDWWWQFGTIIQENLKEGWIVFEEEFSKKFNSYFQGMKEG